MKGDDANWGWNAGALLGLDDSTTLGLSYRSRIKHQLEGTLNGATPIKADITLPDSASLSLHKRLSLDWDLLADATWTGWGNFDELRVRHATLGITLSLVPENWQDGWRYSLGTNYHMSRKWTWRFGLAYDQTPVPDASFRTPRIPDEDRTWLAFGGQYRLSRQGWFDFGHAHLFVCDASINHTEGPITVRGTYRNHVDILGAQYTHSF